MKSFSEHLVEETINEGLAYILENKISLAENVFRYGSEEYFNSINVPAGILNRKSKASFIVSNDLNDTIEVPFDA